MYIIIYVFMLCRAALLERMPSLSREDASAESNLLANSDGTTSADTQQATKLTLEVSVLRSP